MEVPVEETRHPNTLYYLPVMPHKVPLSTSQPPKSPQLSSRLGRPVLTSTKAPGEASRPMCNPPTRSPTPPQNALKPQTPTSLARSRSGISAHQQLQSQPQEPLRPYQSPCNVLYRLCRTRDQKGSFALSREPSGAPQPPHPKHQSEDLPTPYKGRLRFRPCGGDTSRRVSGDMARFVLSRAALKGGFRVSGLGMQADLGFRVWGSGFRVQGCTWSHHVPPRIK